MWYAREKEMPPPNLYADSDDPLDGPDDMVRGADGGVWVAALDDDYDPIYGDLGKVSIMGGDNAENFAMDDDSYKCTADDGGSAATGNEGCRRQTAPCATLVMSRSRLPLPSRSGWATAAIQSRWSTPSPATGVPVVNRTNTVRTTALVPITITDDTSNINDFVKCSVE